MGSRLSAPGPQEKRFAAYLDGLATAAGHEDLSFAKNASANITLRCDAFIAMMQAAELRDLDDPSDA